MAVGQQVLTPIGVLDAALLIQTRLECDELDRGAGHVRLLRDVLELHALFRGDGMGIATVPQVASSTCSSEARAGKLLVEGQALAAGPGSVSTQPSSTASSTRAMAPRTRMLL